MNIENNHENSPLIPQSSQGLPDDDQPTIPDLPTGPPTEETAVVVKPRLPRAGTALLVFLAFFLTQTFLSIVFAIIGVVCAAATGVDLTNAEALQPVVMKFVLYGALPSFILAGVPVWLLTRWLAADAIRDGSSLGVGWTRSTPLRIALGVIFGALLAAGSIFLYATVFKGVQPAGDSIIADMVTTSTVTRVLLVLLAVLCAPLIEEYMFRGVMLAGFTRSFGAPFAIFLCTAIFVLVHIAELIRYWPGTVGIGGLAILAMWLRIKDKSVLPAIGAHFGYNGLLMLLMCLQPLFA